MQIVAKKRSMCYNTFKGSDILILILCVENSFGMSFNGRRVSRDECVIQKIISEKGDSKLYMNGYSAKLFDGYCVENCEDFLEIAGDEDYVFAENVDVSPFEEKVKKMILFKWNRDYPSDNKLKIDTDKFRLDSVCEFPGKSHECITMEVYIR